MQSSTDKDQNKNKIMFFFFNIRLARNCSLVEVKEFIVVVLKVLAFNTSKSYLIYFTTSLYNTSNFKYSIFFTISFKII